MSVVAAQFQGRFGNQLFTWAFAKAYAEKYGHEFQCDPWLGQKIFNLDDKPITATGLTPRNENDIQLGEGNIIIRSYCQQQKCLIYTKRDCLRWFQFQEWIIEALVEQTFQYRFLAHRRVGDYIGYSYPVVAKKSYEKKFDELGCVWRDYITEESPITNERFKDEISFLPDFYAMCHADILLRGNSSFSWWAATLNRHGRIYSPVMVGAKGGQENEVSFVEGNHPRFNADLEFVTDLHLQP